MGNTHTKTQPKYRLQKQVQWKSTDRPQPPGKPELVPGTESTPDVVTIKWARPKSEGGSPITGYLVEHRRTGSPHWVRSTPLLVTVPELTLSGLEPGWRYQFRVTAQNVVGLSLPGEISEPLTVTLQRSVITAPKFTEELHDAVALENEPVEFVVHIIGQPPPKVSWFKDGFEIFSSRRTRITTENGKSVLTIHQVALGDEGEIKCTATNKAGHVSTKSTVKVEAPPKIRLPRQYEDGLLFELDELIRLKVSIAGKPQPLVFWSHNGETIQSSDRYEIIDTERSSTLRIGEAKRADRGEYQIRAVNKLGEDTTSFLVTVTDKPKPPANLKVVMSLGKSVTLTWGAPEDDGGCKIGNYIVEYYRIGWNVWLKAATCRQLTTMLSDLIEGSEYKFRVKAESPYGVSDPSDETDVIFIPDPKRGLLAPPARSRSQPRDANKNPVPPKRRSTSSTRAATREANSPTTYLPAPTPPKREKLKTPQKTPEQSPTITRRNLSEQKNIFDRSSLARELAYGSPEIKYRKPDVHLQQPEVPQRENKSPSPVKRDKSPSRLHQILSSVLPKKSPSPTAIPKLNIDSKNLDKSEEELPGPVEEINTMSSLKGDRMDRLSPNIFARRSSSPMPLDRTSPTPEDKKSRSTSPARARSRSPSPQPRERSPSPSKLSVPSNDTSRRNSLQSYQHNNTDMVHDSSEFMLVILEDQDNPNEDYTIIEEHMIPPPMSLSAPELGSDSPLFAPLKSSVSSTELLHERAFARFMKDAEEINKGKLPEQVPLGRRASFGKRQNLDKRSNDDHQNIPTILINEKEDNEVPIFEKISSFQRRLSAGISSMAEQYIWAKRRHSLRNPAEGDDLDDVKLKPGETGGDFAKTENLAAQEDQDMYRVPTRITTDHQNNSVQKMGSEHLTAMEDEGRKDKSSSEEESDDERFKYDLSPPIVEPQEEEMYHPKDMMFSGGSKLEEPFEILSKPTTLPDPNFVPKPILKRAVVEAENRRIEKPGKPVRRVLQKDLEAEPPSLVRMEQDRSRSPSPCTSKVRPLTPIPSIPETQMISAAEAARKKRMLNRQSSEEECKVAANYYADLVKQYGVNKRQSTPLYLNTEELKSADSEEILRVPSPVEPPPGTATRKDPFPSTYKRPASPLPTIRRPAVLDDKTPIPKQKQRSRSSSRTRTAKRILPPTDIQNKVQTIARTPSPRLLTVHQQALQAETQIKIRTSLDYVTDVAMFVVACWVYLFNDARLAIPILMVMVYRQIKAEVANMLPSWLIKQKKQ